MKEYYIVDTDATLSEKIDEDTVVINLINGCYFNFNPTASYIWELIGCGFELKEIIKCYSMKFNILVEEADSDISKIIDIMLNGNLVKKSETNSISIEPLQTKIPYTKPEIETFDDMQEMLLLDPIHEVTEKGWPYKNDG